MTLSNRYIYCLFLILSISGKRACIGEAFTMIQTFLFLTSIVQNFRLSAPADSKSSSGMFSAEEKILICFSSRTN